jgi:geranylgeranylglycerol-phosphate geranylgeranyltransferase
MNKAKAIFVLGRPLNCLITFLSVWTAALVAGEIYISWRIALASVSAALIAGFGNVVNDIFDINIDKINKQFRPLASGSLEIREAVITAITMGAIGLALSLFVHRYAILVALPALILLALYTPFFKRLFLVGNILIALIAALAFIGGGMAAGKPFGAIVLVIFSFLFHLGREIVKDIQDKEADTKAGSLPEARRINSRIARGAAIAVFSLLTILTFVPFLADHYGFAYLMVVLFGVDLIIIAGIYNLIQTDRPATMRLVAGWLKAAMPMGLLAVYLGSRGW